MIEKSDLAAVERRYVPLWSVTVLVSEWVVVAPQSPGEQAQVTLTPASKVGLSPAWLCLPVLAR